MSGSVLRRTLSGVGWTMGWRMFSRSLGLISVLVLARLLVPSDFGIVAVATSVAATIEALSQLGVREALVRLHDERPDYYDTAFMFQVLRGLLTASILVGLSTVAADWLGDRRLPAIMLVLAAVSLISGCENIGVVRLSRELDFRTQFFIQVVPRLAGFAITVGIAIAWQSYWALIGGIAASRVLGVAMTYVVLSHRPRFSLAGWQYLLGFSIWTWAGSLAMAVWTRSDPFLLGPALGSAAVGVYLLSIELAMMPITEILEPVCATLFPGFSLARRTGVATTTMGFRVAGALTLCTAPLAIGISACSGYLVVALLGPQWEATQPVIAALAWLSLFSPFSYVCSSLLSAQGHVRRVFFINAAAAAAKVGVILVVRQTHDLTSIAIAGVCVVGLEATLFIHQLRATGSTGLSELAMTMGRVLLVGAATTGLVALLPGTWAHVTVGRWSAVLAGAAIGTVTIGLFAGGMALLWMLARRPPGAEAEIAQVLRAALGGAPRRSAARP